MRSGRLLAVAVLAVSACATRESIVADAPLAVNGQEIAPYAFHEECARMVPGDRLDYRFESQAPVDFEIYYQDGITRIAPVSRGAVMESSGIFQPRIATRYCTRWEAGVHGAILDLRIRLIKGTAP